MTRKQSEPAPDTPFTRFAARYTPLYRTLLILGIISIALSLPGIANIRLLFSTFPTDPFYAISGMVSTFIVLPLMISSLILLWNKHPMGIRIRLGGYAGSIAAATLALFTSESTLKSITDQAIEDAKRSGGTTLDPVITTQIAQASFYGALYISMLISILFAWLWWKAWKKQAKTDLKTVNQHE